MMTPITLECTAGRTQTFSRATSNADGTYGGIFNGSETITATVWPADSEAYVLRVVGSPACIWTNAALTQWAVTFNDAATASLTPGTTYRFEVTSTTSTIGQTARLFEGLLEVTSSAGMTMPIPPDLITANYCFQMLSGVTLTVAQQEQVPALISSASSLLREKCNERYFDLRTLTEDYEVTLDGYLRLRQEPVQIVTRVQGQPNLALTVTNSSAQTAQVYFSFTGYDGGYGVNAKTATGITLVQTTNGVPATPVTCLFATYPTITLLANAIMATGVGWRASVMTPYGGWASTELTGGFVGQGCAPGAIPTGGALFNVLTDLDGCKRRPNSPMLYVGTQYINSDAQRWGPGGDQFFDDNSITQGVVRVTYQAGFSVIPADVQNATAQLVKYMLELLKQELLLKSEQAGGYQYELAPEMVNAMPKPVWEMIGARKYHYA